MKCESSQLKDVELSYSSLFLVVVRCARKPLLLSKKSGAFSERNFLKKLFSDQLTFFFVLQDNSKSFISGNVVGIPLEREALHFGTIFLIIVETLKFVNWIDKKKTHLQNRLQTFRGQHIRSKIRLRSLANRRSRKSHQWRGSVRTRERSACQGP